MAFIGNGTAETLDPIITTATIDLARAQNLYDNLVLPNPDLSIQLHLAELMEPNSKADEWTIRLRSGVRWHDGTPLVADDLIYTLMRTNAQKGGSTNSLVTNGIDFAGLKKLDNLTVRVPLRQPNSAYPDFMLQFEVFKNGTTDFNHPIGTGPFKFQSWTPGSQSIFVRNPDYWQDGLPYIDRLELVSIPDQTARLDALLGGEVDAIESLTFVEAKQYLSSHNIVVLEAPGPGIVPIYMAVDVAPFNDVRVRQALRMIANRPQLLESAQLGLGSIGNDIFGKGDPYYDATLPQREQDLDQARFLLKAAGHSGLKLTLYTSTAASGMLESATAFAAEAVGAGVVINVQNVPASNYFGIDYGKYAFAQSEWFAESIPSHNSRALIPPAGQVNETHWHDPEWDSLFKQALSTSDTAKQAELYAACQQIEWERGGYIDWGFFPIVDGLSTSVRGAVGNPAQPLTNFEFRNWWLVK